MKSSKLRTLAATASLVTSASAIVTIDYVTVGNPGNAADPLTGYGAVGYSYQIGKYEVTNAQYAEFLNAKAVSDTYSLYHTDMSSFGITRSGSSGSYNYSVTGGLENRPVLNVSWFEAARFSNWMGNGQGSGDTETGSYTLLGASSGIVTVNTGAKAWIPAENEWYKAAYYNGASSTYSLYPNGQNAITTADANYENSVGSSTDVGTYTSDPSFYGTYDQGGNAFEWNDAVSGSSYVARGGAWQSSAIHFDGSGGLISTNRSIVEASGGPFINYFGFRIASAVPEPSSLVLTMLASSVMLIRRKR